MKTSPKNNKSNAIIAILIGIIIFLFFICLFLFLSQNKTPELSPDIAPKDTDKYSEPMNDDSTDKLDDQGGGAASLACSKNATIELSSEKAFLMFGNPQRSNQDIIIQIVIQDTVIAQSGLILPGSKITTLDLLPGIKRSLSEGVYIGKIAVLFYDKETGIKEILSTEFLINITVKK